MIKLEACSIALLSQFVTRIVIFSAAELLRQLLKILADLVKLN